MEWRAASGAGEKTVYEGPFEKNKMTGQGTLKYGRNEYKGEFKDDFFHGKGLLKWDNRARFEGNFVKGQR